MKTEPQSFSRTRTPPGGWIFYQPSTNWHAPAPVANTFNQQVTNIVKHRISNMASTAKYKLSTDPTDVANELESFTRRRLGLPASTGLPKQTPLHRFAERVGAVADNIGKTKVGIFVVLDWLGSGLRPVDKSLSESRAKICSECPKNQNPNWMQKLDSLAADQLMRLMDVKNEMKASTSLDSQLHSCQACDCSLTLKVHAPLNHIISHLKDETRAALDNNCWILSEENVLRNPVS